ncbi:LLM class flavin-dependent oxidoreductase [Iamia sp. SCSIO 61187]|uniref:LLM class flavin-dependent oxidoreductase n=1 Tax=Iamia sp. SCSIO 61187 TaxID=2722752 RepID=UPI001C636EB7|nr:LLM class flavin-dependent oxidoreductase [Iamia sp. SCSIO 61187]QYG94043.1 LLM class flavin-dependent oxidoreductase [Iamia sp. SCSIO 61187]
MQILGPALGGDPAAEAVAAEAAGFAGVRVLDHLFCALPGGPEQAFDHPFVALGAAAAVTERVVLTQTVLDVTRRHPTEVAQAAATLDRISSGRAELGLGTGWYEPEHTAVGAALGPPAARVDRLIEAAAVCRAMLDGDGRVDFAGRHVQAHVDVPWAPTPHPVPLVVGAARPVLQRRAAALVDRLEILSPIGLGPGERPPDLAVLAHRIDVARTVAAAAGRAIAFSARVTLEVGGRADPADALHLAGSPDDVVGAVADLARLGFDRLTVLPVDPSSQAWLARSVAHLADADAGSRPAPSDPSPVGAP